MDVHAKLSELPNNSLMLIRQGSDAPHIPRLSRIALFVFVWQNDHCLLTYGFPMGFRNIFTERTGSQNIFLSTHASLDLVLYHLLVC